MKKPKFSKTAIHQATDRFRNFRSFQDLYRSGRPKVTSQKDENASALTYQFKNKIRSALLLNGIVVSKITIKRRLTDEFGLKVHVTNPPKNLGLPFP